MNAAWAYYHSISTMYQFMKYCQKTVETYQPPANVLPVFMNKQFWFNPFMWKDAACVHFRKNYEGNWCVQMIPLKLHSRQCFRAYLVTILKNYLILSCFFQSLYSGANFLCGIFVDVLKYLIIYHASLIIRSLTAQSCPGSKSSFQFWYFKFKNVCYLKRNPKGLEFSFIILCKRRE